MEPNLSYGLYNSTLDLGQRVRRMRRTELSYDKIRYFHSPKCSRPQSKDSHYKGKYKPTNTSSMPKLESLYLARAAAPLRAQQQINHLQNEYYNEHSRPKTALPAKEAFITSSNAYAESSPSSSRNENKSIRESLRMSAKLHLEKNG